jgi:hypothetical protein
MGVSPKAKNCRTTSPYKKASVNYGALSIIFIAFFCLCFYPFPLIWIRRFKKPSIQFATVVYNSKLSRQAKTGMNYKLGLKNNTPDPAGLLLWVYQEPGIYKKETAEVNDYEYPDSSYGVLAAWDLGI